MRHAHHESFQRRRRLLLFGLVWSAACLLVIKLVSLSLEPGDREPAGREHHQNLLRWAPELALPDAYAQQDSYAYTMIVSSASSSSLAPPVQHALGSATGTEGAHSPQTRAKSSGAHQDQDRGQDFAGAHCKYHYPKLFDLQFNNVHWQRLSFANATTHLHAESAARDEPVEGSATTYNKTNNYYLYNAYFDDRWRGVNASVRILAMIDRVAPPPTNCLLWFRHEKPPKAGGHGVASWTHLVSQAKFVYAWYPKWGNYHDGALQPWIVTCPVPRSSPGVPDSVSLVPAPAEEPSRTRRSSPVSDASVAMPPSYSSSSSSSAAAELVSAANPDTSTSGREREYDCASTLPVTNNLPVFNIRPPVKQKFAVCVKGLDFPNEDLSVRLVEWIELLNLLGASKIFLYNLDVHENITKVLAHYQKRGLVELNPLTLPGDQPNLPKLQHEYLRSKLTAKRQNELIPYNDCLYRNLYSYEYLALLDIDEIIMPLKHHNWFGLMQEVEAQSLSEHNYTRASYNARNVYFFDDLAGPLGTTSSSTTPPDAGDARGRRQDHELGIPRYLHMMQHVYRSRNYTKPGQYVKCFHNTQRVVSLHNHFPMNCFGQCTTYSIPVELAHLQHYRKDCVGPLKKACQRDFRLYTIRDTTIWKYKQQMIRRSTRVLNQLGLLA